jgi:two-component system, cell cycle response regulator DivK
MRVLLVDDDRDTRIIFRTVFQISGHEVVEAADGLEALRMVEQHALDVILMDLQVPGKNGWETTQALQANPETAHIPVIAVSAHALAEHRERARDAGCVGYLTKPVEPLAVVEEVERILRATRVA